MPSYARVVSSLRNLTATSLSDQAYEAVRRAIAEGDLQPGQRVTERGLASMLAVSPTPVREALQRLIHDGQIERVGPRTLQIADLDDATLAEIDEIEVSLQSLIARFAARKAGAAEIEAMRDALAEADAATAEVERALAAHAELPASHVAQAFAAVRRFHALMESSADNPLLERLTRNAQAFTPEERQSAAERSALHPNTVARYGDHRELLSAIEAHDEDRAAEVAERHARSSHHDIRRSI